MKKNVVAFGCGVVFSLGLGVSGMTNPHKVIGFLDFFGRWDASLLLVMAGAVAVYALGYRIALRRGTPLLADRFHVVDTRRIEPRPIVGGLLFGVGWGIGGYCPGPAVTSMASGAAPAIVFVFAMVVGMAAYDAALRFLRLGAGRRHGDRQAVR